MDACIRCCTKLSPSISFASSFAFINHSILQKLCTNTIETRVLVGVARTRIYTTHTHILQWRGADIHLSLHARRHTIYITISKISNLQLLMRDQLKQQWMREQTFGVNKSPSCLSNIPTPRHPDIGRFAFNMLKQQSIIHVIKCMHSLSGTHFELHRQIDHMLGQTTIIRSLRSGTICFDNVCACVLYVLHAIACVSMNRSPREYVPCKPFKCVDYKWMSARGLTGHIDARRPDQTIWLLGCNLIGYKCSTRGSTFTVRMWYEHWANANNIIVMRV